MKAVGSSLRTGQPSLEMLLFGKDPTTKACSQLAAASPSATPRRVSHDKGFRRSDAPVSERLPRVGAPESVTTDRVVTRRRCTRGLRYS